MEVLVAHQDAADDVTLRGRAGDSTGGLRIRRPDRRIEVGMWLVWGLVRRPARFPVQWPSCGCRKLVSPAKPNSGRGQALAPTPRLPRLSPARRFRGSS